MSKSESPPLRRKRRSGSKVKSGCLTCKQRRTKCDEERPFCHKCLVSARECIGYGDPFRQRGGSPLTLSGSRNRAAIKSTSPDVATPSSRALQVPVGIPLSSGPGIYENPTDAHYFDHFRHVTVHILGDRDQDFMAWMMAGSLSLPAIRHALLALSACHMADRQGTGKGGVIKEYTLGHYSKAVRSVMTQLDLATNETTMLEMLASCFLLIAFELLGDGQEDFKALLHLEGALSLLQSWRPSAVPGSHPGSDMFHLVSNVFTRLDILAVTYLGARDPPPPRRDRKSCLAGNNIGINTKLTSLAMTLSEFECRTMHLIKVEAKGLRYARVSELNGDHVTTAQRWHMAAEYRDILQRQLLEWYGILRAAYPEAFQKQMPIQLHREISRLECRYAVTSISLSACLEPDETAFDRFTSSFNDLVHSAETYLGEDAGQPIGSNSELHPPCFTLEAGVIYPLYLTALKCRDFETRWRAVQLLKRSGREGPWDGVVMARVAEEVIALEKRLALDMSGSQLRGYIPEAARVHSTAIGVDTIQRTVSLDCRVRRYCNSSPESPGTIEHQFWESCKSQVQY